MDIERTKTLLKEQEGFRSKPYRDTLGMLTIGYGRCLDTQPLTPVELEYLHRTLADIEENGLAETEADYLLERNIKEVCGKCPDTFDWFDSLDDCRQAVVISMCFQLGIAGFLKFHKTIGFISSGYWLEAAAEMNNSEAARQCPNRYKELSEMMKEGQWPET